MGISIKPTIWMDRAREKHFTGLQGMGVSTLSLRAGQGWAQAPSLSSSQTSPYLLRLSLKRLEVVGDILQLLLQLRTLTVNILNTAGEERRRGRNKKRRETHRCELKLCGDRVGLHIKEESF